MLDASFAAVIDPSLTPVLYTACAVLQVLILVAATLLTCQDAVRARNKQARRSRRQELARSRDAY